APPSPRAQGGRSALPGGSRALAQPTMPLLTSQLLVLHPASCILVVRIELKSVRLEIPQGGNIIVGQTHFIKSVEDIYEAVVDAAPQMKFGIAFNEASGPCLTRADGNDPDLKALAIRNASALAAGHVFVVAMREGFPINVLGRIKNVFEVCSIF